METNTGSVDTSSSEVAESAAGDGVENQEQAQQQAEAPTPAQKKKLMLKVDGEEFEEEIDFNDEDGLRKKLQLARAAEKRMNEAKSAKAKAFEIIKAFEEDPKNIFKRLGPKGREAAEAFLLEQIQEEMLDPKDKELRDLKKYKEEMEAEREKTKAEKEKAALAEQEARYAQEFQSTIIGALEKSGLPKSPDLVKRMASVMAKNLDLGIELTAEELASEVRSEIQGLLKSIVKDADGDHLLGLFGEDIATKIRKSDLRKLQEKQSAVFQSPKSVSASAPRKQEGRPMSMEEWKKQLEERIK